MSLRQRQSEFAYRVGLLIQFAYDNGYELTIGDAWAFDLDQIAPWLKAAIPAWLTRLLSAKSHKTGSFHYDKLAIDLNLFRDGKYLQDTEHHRPLGHYWESLGGSWGGRFGDGNHYSWGE